MKTALVLGAGGFIGGHLVKRLKREGFWVRGVDLKFHEYAETQADDFVIADLREQDVRASASSTGVSTRSINWPPTWAAPAISSPANTTPTSCTIRRRSTSTCSTPPQAQHQAHLLFFVGLHVPGLQPGGPRQSQCARTPPIPPRRTANMAGKSFSPSDCTSPIIATTACRTASRATTTSSAPKARGTAARKRRRPPFAARWPKAKSGEIEIWGDGLQTRSFLYIDECVEGMLRLTRSDFEGPVNIGSDEMVTINQLVDHGRRHRRQADRQPPHPRSYGRARAQQRKHDDQGKARLPAPSMALRQGLEKTYEWIDSQVRRNAP